MPQSTSLHVRTTSITSDDANDRSDNGEAKQSRIPYSELHPNIKKAIYVNRKNRAKARENKMKNESKNHKRKRLSMEVSRLQRKKKKLSMTERKTPLENRPSLSTLEVGSVHSGRVISLTPFGCYVDIGTTVDGLLHVRDMDDEEFVSHPRERYHSGDDIEVRVKFVDPEKNILGLRGEKCSAKVIADDSIKLDEIGVDDELWGVITKVTSFGAFVNLGCEVEGFLHFMEHPDFPIMNGEAPSEYMRKGDRVKVWVLDIDEKLRRIKLSGYRSKNLPLLSRF